MTKGLTKITFAKLLEEGSTDLDSDTKVTEEDVQMAEESARRASDIADEYMKRQQTDLLEPLRKLRIEILGLR